MGHPLLLHDKEVDYEGYELSGDPLSATLVMTRFTPLTYCAWVSRIAAEVRAFLVRKGGHVAEVRLDEKESFESLLRRFNRKVQQHGILSEIRRRERYEKPSVRRKKKEAAKRRKSGRSSWHI